MIISLHANVSEMGKKLLVDLFITLDQIFVFNMFKKTRSRLFNH